MRIFIINTGYGLSEKEIQVRVDRMKKIADSETEITMECLHHTEICIDSQIDVCLAAPEIIRKAIQAERDGYDAIGIYCTSDPAMRACREAVDIPVIGAGQAAFATAMLLGDSWSFITTSVNRRSEKVEFARQCGVDITRLASVQSIQYDILKEQKEGNEEILKQNLYEIIMKCKKENHADVAILGCLSFAGMGKELSDKTGIPVIDPAYVLVTTAEAIVKQGLSHSKQSFSNPPTRTRSWGAGVIEI